MKKKYLGILVLAALPPTLAAASQFHRVPGAICTESFGADTSVLRGPQFENWGTSGLSVSCAIPFTSTTVNPVTVDPATSRVDYMDSNATSGIACALVIVTTNNTSISTGNVYSCSTAGGCASSTPSYVGTNYLTLPDNIGSTANVVGMAVNCAVPAYDSTNGASGILGLATATTTP